MTSKNLTNWIVLFFFVGVQSGCATRAIPEDQVGLRPDRGYLAFSSSINDSSIESLKLSSSELAEYSLSLRYATLHLAGEDVFIFELDPSLVYAVTSMRMDKRTWKLSPREIERSQIELQPGVLTYVASLMVWAAEEDNPQMITSVATESSTVSVALKNKFTGKKLSFGYR